MPIPQLELDDRFFTILTQTDSVAISKHKISGSLTVWRLEWKDRADLPAAFEARAWEIYLNYVAGG